MNKLIVDYDDNSSQGFSQVQLDPSQDWVRYLHDFELGHFWDSKEPPKNRAGYNRRYTLKGGDPETVAPYEKEDRVSLDPAWDKFNKQLFCLDCFGTPDLAMFPLIKNAFENVMGPKRVITNYQGYPDGYMPLAMGGGIGHVLGESKPDAKYGPSYVIEALNAKLPPPDPEEVFFEKRWLWNAATNCRCLNPEDNVEGLANPWQHVNWFSQLDAWNGRVPLMLISNTGVVQIKKVRCAKITDYKIPNPYHPEMARGRVKDW